MCVRHRIAFAVLIAFVTSVISKGDDIETFSPKVTKFASPSYGCAGYYSEGPVFDSGGTLYFVSPYHSPERPGNIYKVDPASGNTSVFAQPKVGDYYGMPNGADADQKGNLWITDLRLGLVKVSPSGSFKQMVTHDTSGELIQGFNDVTIDYTGSFWITAPVGKIAPTKYDNGMSFEPMGSIYSYLPHENKLRKLDTGYRYSNGIAVQHSKEGKPLVLIVAETLGRNLWAYNITAPGEIDVKSKRLWGRPDVDPEPYASGYDGMDIDAEGNLLVTEPLGSSIHVYPPEGGAPISSIKLPFPNVTNLEFKPGSNKVYVTQIDPDCGLWTFEWINKGMMKYRDRVTSSASLPLSSLMTVTLLLALNPFRTAYM